eukprot:scaffold282584_cov35-Tisochrysis_lutea.AAC.2
MHVRPRDRVACSRPHRNSQLGEVRLSAIIGPQRRAKEQHSEGALLACVTCARGKEPWRSVCKAAKRRHAGSDVP